MPSVDNQDTDDIVEFVGRVGFEETLGRLLEVIKGAGLTLFARIDHARGARDVGLEMPPTTVLVYGDPKGGTPIMLAAPRAALDLPLRVLVRQTHEGRTVLAFHRIDRLLSLAGVDEELARSLVPAQRLLVKVLDQ